MNKTTTTSNSSFAIDITLLLAEKDYYLLVSASTPAFVLFES